MTMRQSHAPSVDYADDGAPVVIDRRTAERRSAQIFVAVLGASSFTYAQATWTQGAPDSISGHVGAFEAAVIQACLYDSQINRSYADTAAHCGTAIPPARPRRPRDKVKVGRHNYPNLEELAGAIGCHDLGASSGREGTRYRELAVITQRLMDCLLLSCR